MARIRLKYVNAFIDRHGKARHYFRRPGFQQVPLRGLPGSAEFMEAYQVALAGAPRIEIGAERIKPGTVAAAVAGYFGSGAFTGLAESTRRSRRQILERFRVEHGGKGIATIQRVHIERIVVAKAAGVAMNFLAALRALMGYAVMVGLRTDDPTVGVRSSKRRSTGGFYTWTEADITTFEAKYPIGTRARLALALLLYTAQRRADVIRLGRQHVRDGVIYVRQRKTGAMLEIPIAPELRAVLDVTPASEQLTFLVTRLGRPFEPDAFTHWFKAECRAAGLPSRASVHGLRKAACRRLAEAGCSANVIAAVSGPASLREVERYTKAADQARMARQGIEAIAGTKTAKPG
jgi:integrase